jgi:hypothetical protein
LLLGGIYINLKKNKFVKQTGGWKKLEQESWHGTKSDFINYYNNSKQYKRSGVYIHKNLDTGKCYVGQSRDIFSRVYREINGQADNVGCKALYEAYRHGYRFEIVLIFWKKGYPNLNKMERAYINQYDTMRRGYNRTWGNDESSGETIYK